MFTDITTIQSEIDYRRDQLKATVVRRPERHRRTPWSRRVAAVSDRLR